MVERWGVCIAISTSLFLRGDVVAPGTSNAPRRGHDHPVLARKKKQSYIVAAINRIELKTTTAPARIVRHGT